MTKPIPMAVHMFGYHMDVMKKLGKPFSIVVTVFRWILTLTKSVSRVSLCL